MNEQQPNLIEAQPAPLSHLQKRQNRSVGVDARIVGVVVVVAVLAVAIYLWAPYPVAQDTPPDLTVSAVDGTPTPTQNAGDNTGLAPFAESQRKIVRERAQASLSRFVEGQLRLENEMQVDAWGQVELDAARARALTGDAAFAQEKFEEALTEYAVAADLIAEVLNKGDALFEQHIAAARQASDELAADAATAALASARRIKPEAPSALALQRRVDNLPQLIGLLRTAKNHQLADRYDEARTTYQEAQQLDGQALGIEAALADIDAQIRQANIAAAISSGFAALEQGRFNQARQAFRQALTLEPNNAIALGGLEQVAQNNDLSVINTHRRDADAALAEEAWDTALEHYAAILKLDPNIQFAVTGQGAARAHKRAQNLLTAITSDPGKLSAQALFLDAQQIVKDAEALEHRGPQLNAMLDETRHLIELYRNPVEVVLLSDNATDIVMSNLGRLGYFDQKVVTLRPGQYTIRGSQRGCRDLYLSVEVLPGIEPLDLSCPEPLQPR